MHSAALNAPVTADIHKTDGKKNCQSINQNPQSGNNNVATRSTPATSISGHSPANKPITSLNNDREPILIKLFPRAAFQDKSNSPVKEKSASDFSAIFNGPTSMAPLPPSF